MSSPDEQVAAGTAVYIKGIPPSPSPALEGLRVLGRLTVRLKKVGPKGVATVGRKVELL